MDSPHSAGKEIAFSQATSDSDCRQCTTSPPLDITGKLSSVADINSPMSSTSAKLDN